MLTLVEPDAGVGLGIKKERKEQLSKRLSPVISTALTNLGHDSDAGPQEMTKSGAEETSAKGRDRSHWLA
jgi:hypothetical protein